MGFFSSPKIFTTHQQIHEALYHITSLDEQQREVVYQAFVEKLGDGGVTAEELKKVAQNLRAEGVISEIDKQNLLHLIK